MLAIMAVGPLLRWRQDRLERISKPAIAAAVAALAALVIVLLIGGVSVLPLLGLALAAGLAVASFMPLRGRKLTRVPTATWGMVIAHFGIAVALFGMASESAFSEERLAAVEIGGSAQVGKWKVALDAVDPVAGPNWTALQGRLFATYGDGSPIELGPQSRDFWSPVQQTTESALVTRWNGQLYAVLGNQNADGRWQLRLWWKPFVTFIWYGGMLVALGGLLALIGRLVGDIKRRRIRARGDVRRADEAELAAARPAVAS